MFENNNIALYLSYADRLDKLRQRRQAENRFFVALASALLVAGTYLIRNSSSSPMDMQIGPASIIGFGLLGVIAVWQIHLYIYRRTAKSMHMVLRELERNTLFPCDQREFFYLTGKVQHTHDFNPSRFYSGRYSFLTWVRRNFPLFLLIFILLGFIFWALILPTILGEPSC